MNKPAGVFILSILFVLTGAASAAEDHTPSHHLGTLDLPAAIEMALGKNYTLQVERFTPKVAEQILQSARGTFDPSVVAQVSRFSQETDAGLDPNTGLPTASIVESENFSLALQGLTPFGTRYSLGYDVDNARTAFRGFRDQYDSFAGLSFTQPLLDGFGAAENLARIRVARAGWEQSDWQFRQTLIDVITEVVSSYNLLYFAKRNLEVAIESRDLARTLLRENQRRVELGTMADVDTLQAASQLALREERVLNARRLYLNQKIQFLAVISNEIEGLLDLDAEITPPAPAVHRVTEVGVDFRTALDNRPDFQSARLDLRSQEILLARDRRRALPTLNLFGQLGYGGFDRDAGQSFDEIGTLDYETWSLGASLDVPLTNRTARADRTAGFLLRNQADKRIDRLRQQILVLVDNGARRIQTDWERIEAARKAREITRRSLRGEEKRLELGTTSSFVVLRLQSDLAEADVRELQAIVDYNQSLAEYDRILGITLERHNVETRAGP